MSPRRHRRTSSKGNYAQRHYSVTELCQAWGVPSDTVKSLFLREPGVLILPSNSSSTDAIHVPESVVERVYRRITNAGHAAVSSPSEDKGYDVFLAHNSNDKSHVEAIGKQLRRRRLHPWLDKWYIPPGRMFQKEIEHALSSSKSIAIFIGPDGLGRWETMEMRSAISQFVDREAPVIPVLLPGIEHPELPPFMRELLG